MRNFSKTLISMAAVMAVGSAMAAGAMAAMTAEYADGYITISGIPTTYENTALTQHTLLVVQGTVNGETVDYVISDGSAEGTTCTIKQIDQDDSGAAFKKEGATDAVVYVGDLADGSYKVMVGNNAGSLDEDEFTVGEDVKPIEITVGDVNNDNRVNGKDPTAMARYGAKVYDDSNAMVGTKYTIYNTSDTIIVGDINRDNRVNGKDPTAMARYGAKVYDDSNETVGDKVTVVPYTEN